MSDTIYRDDAVRAVCKGCLKENPHCRHHWDCPMLTNLGKLPSADRWIPCTEREPNEFEDVLVLLSDGTMDVLQLTDYLDIWGNVKWCHAVNHGMGYAVSNNDVVAWMPLPEPYEKGADDDQNIQSADE